jgi:outer membrane protein assembly factor BamB
VVGCFAACHCSRRRIHVLNSYASPTPVTDGERLYCHFGSIGTVAMDLKSGEVVWQKRFSLDEITGPGSSPVLCDGLLILTCDGADDQFLTALQCATGDVVWRTARPPIVAEDDKLRRAFSTPLVIEHAGRKQLIAPGAQWVVAYSPATGEELWRVRNSETGHAVVPRPVYRAGVVYICTGWVEHQLWAIRVDGTGDVTESHVLWKHRRQAPEIASPIIVGGEIYFASTLGIATCLDVETGEMLWQHRLGGSYAASPLSADGKLYFTNTTGTTTVLQPGREYQELARNQLHGQTLASLAVYGESLLIRTDSAMYCVRQVGDPQLAPNPFLPKSPGNR